MEGAGRAGGAGGARALLAEMFGAVLAPELLETLLQTYAGNLQETIEAAMTLADGANQEASKTNTIKQPEPTSSDPKVSYANRIGAIPKNAPRESRALVRNHAERMADQAEEISPHLNDQFKRIIDGHKNGYRILIIMRGVPGSGKSYLARQIVNLTVGNTPMNQRSHIFSTDNYFSQYGNYVYDVSRLGIAHEWNQQSVRNSLTYGLSPVIVDNTNVELWEMKAYVIDGVRNGYSIEIVEPLTPWAKNARQLVKKNSHNVPYSKIVKMLDNYAPHYSADILIRSFGLSYPADNIPPVLRKTPPLPLMAIQVPEGRLLGANHVLLGTPEIQSNTNLIQAKTTHSIKILDPAQAASNKGPSAFHIGHDQKLNLGPDMSQKQQDNTSEIKKRLDELKCSAEPTIQPQEAPIPNKEETGKVRQLDEECQKQSKEFKQLCDWDKGDPWETVLATENSISGASTEPQIQDETAPKPQREKSRGNSRTRNEAPPDSSPSGDLIQKASEWQEIFNSVPAWDHDSTTKIDKPKNLISEKVTIATMTASNDLEDTSYRVIDARPRDINFYYTAQTEDNIPQKRMLDKSSMAIDDAADIIIDPYRCKNEDIHFIAFRKMFKHIAEEDLKDIFDKCCGNVQWAVEIVLEDAATNEIGKTQPETHVETAQISDQEDEHNCSGPMCDCVAACNDAPIQVISTSTMQEIRKVKKDKTPSESSVHLKRQIEKNVTIADNHYSNHCLKLRNLRRGDMPSHDYHDPNEPSTSSAQFKPVDLRHVPGKPADPNTSSSDDDSTNAGGVEETFNVVLGGDFIRQMDQLMYNTEMDYSENIVPVVNMPKSLLDQISALWMESLMHQVAVQSEFSEVLLKEDEELAKALADKEAEMAREGVEPEVPDFREIMDLDFAQALYNKDISEWKNQLPEDIASKMTRDKLYNLFPEVDKEILLEMLIAHDHKFQETVEIVLGSFGWSSVLLERNGVNKFLMEREKAHQQKMMDEDKKKELEPGQWPELTEDRSTTLSTVEAYREKARNYLDQRNRNISQAQAYVNRGMTPAAVYYFDLAAFYKKKFEKFNSMAAAAVIQMHASKRNRSTLDLHFLYVAEALQALDMFLDKHIEVLCAPGTARDATLFVITGRGLHSPFGPRIKPAVRRRLTERGFVVQEMNPGLLSITVTEDCKKTYQL